MPRKLIRSFAALALVAGVAAAPLALFAQTDTPPAGVGDIGTPYVPPAGASGPEATAANAPTRPRASAAAPSQYPSLESCFDYYAFGSTPVSVSAGLSSIIAGAPLAFSASVKNNNPYPIVDATVYVKVLRYGYERGEKNVNGPDVVGFFPVSDPLTILPGQQADLRGTWDVPQDAEAGEYMMAAYVVAGDRFNLAGLTFTDDVIGGAYNFQVINDRAGAVKFDKTTATVLDNPFYFAAFPPRVPTDTKEVPVGIDIVNTTAQPVSQEISWTLYSWDGLRAEQVIDRKTETVSIAPGERAHVSYVATDTDHSVYYLLGSLTTGDGSSSLVGVRFVRGDVNEPRLNFVGATAYPAAPGAAAFACVHSTGTGPAENGRLELSVKRPSLFGFGGTIAQKTYEGPFSGEVLALAAPFTKAAKTFSVTAKLFQNGALVDEVTVPYNCEDLDPDSCPASSGVSLTALIGGAAALIIVIIAIAAFLIIRRRRTAVTPPSLPSL